MCYQSTFQPLNINMPSPRSKLSKYGAATEHKSVKCTHQLNLLELMFDWKETVVHVTTTRQQELEIDARY